MRKSSWCWQRVGCEAACLLKRCDACLQVDAYIRQVNGLPPREPPQQPRAAAAAAPADTAEPSEGNGRRNRGTVQAEQVGAAHTHVSYCCVDKHPRWQLG
jgi:hypothetical protein